jgi:hypothetical protein
MAGDVPERDTLAISHRSVPPSGTNQQEITIVEW